MRFVPPIDLTGLVPSGPPVDWPLKSRGDFVYWAFLDDVSDHPVRPWLIVEETESAVGTVRFAIPRRAPEADWPDRDAYFAWEEEAWKGETTTSIPELLSVDDAADALPKGRTRPRWANRQRLVSVALRADFQGKSAAAIVKDDGEDCLKGERRRSVHKEIQRAREFLAALGALPWVALNGGAPNERRTDWWKDHRFADELVEWRHDAADLSWRASREMGPIVDPVRDAAQLILRAPWIPPDARTAALARARLTSDAQRFPGACDEWLERLVGHAHQTPECRRDLVQRADRDGSSAALRDIWSESRSARFNDLRRGVRV